MLINLFKNSNKDNPNLLIQGPDGRLNEYLADDYLHQKQFAELERVSIDCESDGLDALIATITEAGLFSSQKVITIKNPFFLTAKVPKNAKKQIEQLQKIFEHFDEFEDILIIVANYEKLDQRKKLTKLIKKDFNVVMTTFKPYESGQITKKLIELEGYHISPNALHLLLDRSDQVMDTVLANYEKLKVLTDESKKISEQMVEQNVDLTLAQNIFEILTAAINKNYQEAIVRLKDELRAGASPIQLLAIFENQLEVLTTIKVLQQKGENKNGIAQRLAIHPYRVTLGMQTRVKLGKLEKLLKEAILLDFGYKNGTYRSDKFLETFLLKI